MSPLLLEATAVAQPAAAALFFYVSVPNFGAFGRFQVD